MTSQLWWYTARAAGLVSWILLAMSMAWGLVLSTKLRPPRLRPNWSLDLHRYLGGLAVVFTGVHVGAIMLDSYVHFGVAEVLIPFASSWKPSAVAWGIVGMYLLLAVELSSLARKNLSFTLWRRLHLLAFPLFVVATVHLISAGTDVGTMAVSLTVVALGVTVAGLAAVRSTMIGSSTPRRISTPRVSLEEG